VSRALIDYLAPWLLDHPEEVEIDEVENERGATVLEVSVHPDDIGKLIGKRGRIIQSLRILARAAGQREGTTVLVEVVD
jgi:predicted RNA-binding protein YlqC (UPF0109 family)